MSTRFPTLIGQFIHHCGAIELLINNSIRFFSSDDILSSSTARSPLAKRINLLQKLLADRSELDGKLIDELCKKLHDLRKKRNIVAHSPIVKENIDGFEKILTSRYKADSVSSDKVTKNELATWVNESLEIMIKFNKYIPNK